MRPLSNELSRGSSRRSVKKCAYVRRKLEEQRDALVADYFSGKGSVLLARKYGVVDSTVIKHLKAAGVQMRTGEKLTAQDMVEVRRLRQMGWSQQKIADRFGVNRSTISLRLSREQHR